jgi:uncharacterized membrane protein YdjX (TVP38/TMEM64 family)
MSRASVRPLLGAAFLLALISLFFIGHMHAGAMHSSPTALLAELQIWGHHNWLWFLLLQTLVAISGFVPASLVGIAAGTVYGLLYGFMLATASALIGSFVAFALGRSILRPWVEEVVSKRPHFQRLDDAIAQNGWRSVALLRLSPVMPFALTSYTLGLTAITWRNYILGTLASLPSLFCYVALGHLTRTGLEVFNSGPSSIKLVMLAIGVVATAGLAINFGRLLKSALAKEAPRLMS